MKLSLAEESRSGRGLAALGGFMRSLSLVTVTSLFIVMSAVAQDKQFTPPITLPQAIEIADQYIKEKGIDVSKKYLASVKLVPEKDGTYMWAAQWMSTEQYVRGGWFILKVAMDKHVILVPGK